MASEPIRARGLIVKDMLEYANKVEVKSRTMVVVLVLESKSLLLLSFSAPGTCNRIRIRLKEINEYCFTHYPVRKRTVETKPINSDLTHMRVFRPRESLLCQQTTSTYKVAEATKMF